jgi:hypothetical protein
MTEPEFVAIDLTNEERELIVLALNEYAGTAQHTYKLLCPVLGRSDKHDWFQLINRLSLAIKDHLLRCRGGHHHGHRQDCARAWQGVSAY